MSWRIATRHVSRYRYAEPVVASYNEARMTPCAGPQQLVLDSQLIVSPPTTLFRYSDYWGTLVHAFDIHQPHDELVVTGTSLVEVSSPPPREHTPSWGEVGSSPLRDRFAELLTPTSYAPFDADLAATITALCDGATPAEAVQLVIGYVRDVMRYEPGSTEVSTSALEAWRQGSGVCQDFAHLSLSLLRQLRLPARYTSGYVYPRAEAGIGESVHGASHAWIEVWLEGFVALDPTTGEAVGERHVPVARGRDYSDVTPLRGVYHGGELDELSVSVELTRVA